MKIALVSQEYPPETARGGIGSQTYSKAHGLTALGHEVYVISRRDTRGLRTKQGEVNVIRVPGYDDYFYEHDDVKEWKKHSKVIAFELNDLHSRVGLDLIDFPEWGAEGYEYLLSFAKENKVPTVVQLHGPLVMFAHAMHWPERDSEFYRTGTEMEAACVRLADAVYSSSACSTNWIKQYYQPEKEVIPTIHLGIDTAFFRPQPVAKHARLAIVFA
ncbi:MAG TPA: glycosyltransferase, partial [Flavisolibacter sp.]|nr:glycosyltransferase [Flavisolibacter sp.]